MLNSQPPDDAQTAEVDDIVSALAGWPGHVGLRRLLRSALAPGKIVNLAGPSGSGKSRLLFQYLTDPQHTVFLSTTQDAEDLQRTVESVGTSWPHAFGVDQLPAGRSGRQLAEWALKECPGVAQQLVFDPVALSPAAAAKSIRELRGICRRQSIAAVVTTDVPVQGADTYVELDYVECDWAAPARVACVDFNNRRRVFYLKLDADGRLIPGGGCK